MESVTEGVSRNGIVFSVSGPNGQQNLFLKISPKPIAGPGYVTEEQLEAILAAYRKAPIEKSKIEKESKPPASKPATTKVEVVAAFATPPAEAPPAATPRIPDDKVDEFLQATEEEKAQRSQDGDGKSDAGDSKPVRTTKKGTGNRKGGKSRKVSKPDESGGK